VLVIVDEKLIGLDSLSVDQVPEGNADMAAIVK
jgi:hypothetical protein